MNILLVLVITALISLVQSEEKLEKQQERDKRSSTLDRMPLHYGKRIPSRSLRSILDRMSAGYGKRDSGSGTSRQIMTVDDLAALVLAEPVLAQKLIKSFIDTNGDGLISVRELYGDYEQ